MAGEPIGDLWGSVADAAEPGGPLAEILNGLNQVARSPLWPIGIVPWGVVVERVTAFAWRWGARARAAEWSDLSLYGLHRRAPHANLAAMGAAWLMARSGHRVIDVAGAAIRLRTATGAELQILRAPIDPEALLAWSIVPARAGRPAAGK